MTHHQKSALQVIFERRSVRAFSSEPVTGEERRTVLDAMRRAPTAGNMMLYSVLDVQRQSIKDRLAVTCDNQPWIADAPMVLVFLADYQRWMDFYEYSRAPEAARRAGIEPRTPGLGDLFLAASDALIAAQTAVIAAEALGLASCYVGDILEQHEVHRDLFELPPWATPVAMLCIGHPRRAERTQPLRPRLPQDTIVYPDRYRRLTPEELDEAFAEQHAPPRQNGSFLPGAENFGQHNYLRKFTADFSREMDRSVTAAVERWKARPS